MPVLLAILLAIAACAAESGYQDAISKWRSERETALKADGGWLTVTGLIWLKEGANRVATAPGVFELHNSKTLYRPDHSAPPTEMKPGVAVNAGDLTLSVIERGGRYAVRVKDKQSKLRKDFRGLHWFPVRESYRVQAKFVAEPRQVAILNIIGNHYPMPSPGYVTFQIDGRQLRLDPVVEEDSKDEFFFIFRDRTAGKETYPAGRFLYTSLPRGGMVELDFNKAENPPCAFTPYATCPLPPKQNLLPIRIEAGELAAHP